MKRLWLVLGVTVALAVCAAAQAPKTRTVHISVTDDEGAPVTALSPSDLSVTEDGVSRPVVSVATATDSLSVGIVLDDRALWAPPVRASVRDFARSLAGRAAVGVFSYSRPEWTVLDFTRDDTAVGRALDEMAAVPTTNNSPEGLIQTLARRLQKQESSHGVLVVLTFGAPTCQPRNCPPSVVPRWDLVLADLLRGGTTVYAVGTNPIEPAHLIYTAAEATGGSAERLLTDSAASVAMQRTAEEILSTQALTYASDVAPRGGLRLRVTATRPGLHVHAPERVF